MSKFDVAVLGNAPVDALVSVPDAFLAAHGLRRGDFNAVSAAQFEAFKRDCTVEKLESGGSGANTGWTMAQFGSKVAFLGRVGDDVPGRHFYQDMLDAGVWMPEPQASEQTMEIYVLISEGGERTFVTQGVTSPLSAGYVSEEVIADSSWLLIEGYVMLDQMEAVDRAIALARKHGVKIAMTLAAMFVMEQCYQNVASEILKGVDLLIANDEEMGIFMRKIEEDSHDGAVAVAQHIVHAPRVITYGPKGASFVLRDEKLFLPCPAVENPVDTTGAGDAFAAGFLHAYIHGEGALRGLALGHLLAGKVIMQVGGRLQVVDSGWVADATARA